MSGRDTPDASGVRKLLSARRVGTDRFAAGDKPEGSSFAARRLFRSRDPPCGETLRSKRGPQWVARQCLLPEPLRSLEQPEGNFPLTPDFARRLDLLRRENGYPEGRPPPYETFRVESEDLHLTLRSQQPCGSIDRTRWLGTPKRTVATLKLEFLRETYKFPKNREILKVFTGGSLGIRCFNAFAYKMSINLSKQNRNKY